jgi:hypothetical protein
LSDTGAALTSLFDDQSVSGFASLSIGSIVTTTDLVLTAAQTSTLFTRGYSVSATAGHKVTYHFDDGSRSSNTTGVGGVVTAARDWAADGSIIDVEFLGITSRAYTSYDVFYGTNGKPLETLYSNGMNATWSYNAAGLLHDIAYFDVTGRPYTQYDVVYGPNGKPATATYSNGLTSTWTYNTDGSLHDVAYTGVTGQAYTSYDVLYGTNNKPASATYSNGMSATWSYDSNGVLQEIKYQNVQGKNYTAQDLQYDSSGKLAISINTNLDGSKTIAARQDALTLTAIGGTETLTGAGHVDEVFSFIGLAGHATVADFAAHISGPDHDTLSIAGTASIGNLTQLIAATTFDNKGAHIAIDANNTIDVPGLTLAAVNANLTSFQVHS